MRFFYAFHNKIITFITAVVSFLVISFLAYQIFYGLYSSNLIISGYLSESAKRFNMFVNSKIDISDKIVKTLLDDEILSSALETADRDEVIKRLNFYNHILGGLQIEIIDSKGNYFSPYNTPDYYAMSDDFISAIFQNASPYGELLIIEENDLINIKYVMRSENKNEIIASGFTIGQQDPFINHIRNITNSEITLLTENKIITSTIDYKSSFLKLKDITSCFNSENSIPYYIKDHKINNILYSTRYETLKFDRAGCGIIIGFTINKHDRVKDILIAVSVTIAVTIFVFILIILFSFYISVRMAFPLRLLRNASAKNACGEIVTVEYTGNNEIAELIRNYNTMILELKDKRDDLDVLINRKTVELRKKNTELKLINEKSQRELSIAVKLHDLLSHENKSSSEVLEISTMYIPVESEGDVQHCFYRAGDGCIGLLIFEIHEKGLPSTLLSSLIRLSFNKHARGSKTIADIFSQISKELHSLISNYLDKISIFYCIVDSKNKKLYFVNISNADIYIQKKSDILIPIKKNEKKISDINQEPPEETKIDMEQHDRLIYISSDKTGSEKIVKIIKNNIYKTTRELIDELFLINSESDSSKILSVLSSDFIFIEREAVITPDLTNMKEAVKLKIDNTEKADERKSYDIFINAIESFEVGKYDNGIRELNRLLDKYSIYIDKALVNEMLGHCYYRLESYEECRIYWQNAFNDDNRRTHINENISVVKGIIEEQKMRKQ